MASCTAETFLGLGFSGETNGNSGNSNNNNFTMDDDYLSQGDDNYSTDTESSGGGPLSSNHHQNQSQNQHNVDQILAEEMNKLSVQERVQALEDIHGVSGTVDADEATIQQKLRELDVYISKHKTRIYKLAESMSPTYVQNADFRLQFLQADFFDVTAAAKRLFKFVEYKEKLFGQDKLVKDITIDDLDQDDLEILQNGILQVLLNPDSAGRPIMACFSQRQTIDNQTSLLRMTYYIFMSISVDFPEVRKKGFVWVFYNTKEMPSPVSPRLAWRCLKLRHSLPIRTVTNHFCTYNGPGVFFRTILAMWWRINQSYTRVRVRRHRGGDKECRAQLRAFGLPMECFPVDDMGVMNLRFHQEWIRRRKCREEATASQQVVHVGLKNEEKNKTNNNLKNNRQVVEVLPATKQVQSRDDQQSRATTSLDNTTNEAISDMMEDAPATPVQADTSKAWPDLQGSNMLRSSFVSSLDSSNRSSSSLPIPPGHGSNNLRRTSFVSSLDASNRSTSPPLIQQHSPIIRPSSAISSPSEANNNLTLSPGALEDAASLSSMDYLTPMPNDVLFGRGKPTRNHPGNVHFRNLLEAHNDEYNAAPKFVKCMIAKKLVQTLSDEGARFLKPTIGANGGWVMADEKTAQDKVSQYFRSRRGQKP